MNSQSTGATPSKAPDRFDYQWRVYGAFQELIRFADTKASAILAANAALAVAVVSVIDSYLDAVLWNAGNFLGFLAALFLLSLSVGFALRCMAPRTRAAEEEKNLPDAAKIARPSAKSLISFSEVFSCFPTAETYQIAVNKRFGLAEAVEPADDAWNDLNAQIWTLAWVATKKHECVTSAIIYFGLSCLFALIASLITVRM